MSEERERDDSDLGGDPPCWAHLMEDEDAAPQPPPAERSGQAAARPDSILAARASRRRPAEAPQHPKVAATVLMVGVVVLLALIGLSPLLGR